MFVEKLPIDIINYIDKHWKPNQDDNYVMIEKDSELYSVMLKLFNEFFELTPDEQEEQSFNVGPFVGIKPYSVFESETDPHVYEFLFEYKDIDRQKIKGHHLLIH